MSQQQSPDGQPHDYQKWLLELKREDAQRAHDRLDDFAEATNRSAVENANLALRYAILINGGAAIAVLGFIGALAGREHGTAASLISGKLADAASALRWFAIGVAAATLAMGFSYFTNYSIATQASLMMRLAEHPWSQHTVVSKRWFTAAIVCQLIAIFLALGSLFLFMVGMLAVKDAIIHLV